MTIPEERAGKKDGWRAYLPPLVLLATLLVAWALLQVFPLLQKVLFLALVGVLLSMMLHYPVKFLSRWMPRAVALALTVVALLGMAAGFVLLLVPLVGKQVTLLKERAPEALKRLTSWWEKVSGNTELPSASEITERLQGEVGAILQRVIPVAAGTFNAIGETLVVLVLALFLAYKPEVYVRGFVQLFPPARETQVSTVVAKVGDALGGWVKGTLGAMVVVGLLSSVGLLIIGVDSWLVLGLFSMLGEFIPFLGPIFAGGLGILVALGESPQTAVKAAILYLIVQQLEANVVQPVVMKQAVHIEPALLLLWQLVFLQAFGLVGLFVATPLLAMLQTLVQAIYVEGVLKRRPSGVDPPAAA